MSSSTGGEYKFTRSLCGVDAQFYSSPTWGRYYDDGNTVKRVKPKPEDIKYMLTNYGRVRYGWNDAITRVIQGCCANCVPSTDFVHFSIRNSVGLPSAAISDKDYSNIFRSRLLSKIKGQKVNLAMALVTYKQTASMFTQGAAAFLQLVRGIRALRVPRYALRRWNHLTERQKRDVSLNLKAEWTTKELANTWLIAQFGLKPLISDLIGSLELLDEGLAKPIEFEVRSRFSEEWTQSTTRGPGGTPPYRFYGTQTDQIQKIYRGKAYVELEPSDAALLTAQGLGFTNPAFLLWDWTPLSFLFDYFIDVGSWLDNLDALVGVRRYAAYYSCTTKTRTNVLVNGINGTSYYDSYNRTKLFLSNPLPTFAPSLSKTRVANMVALLRQQGAIHRIR